MKLSESPSVAVSTLVMASPEHLWGFVTDINAPAAFSTEFQGAEWLSDAPHSVGSTFRGLNQRGDRSWDTTCTVTAWVDETLFTYVVEDFSAPVAIWSYALNREGQHTRLTYTAIVGPGESGVTRAVASDPANEDAIVEGRLSLWRTNMVATLAGLKGLAEA